jgi:hypothetical protein
VVRINTNPIQNGSGSWAAKNPSNASNPHDSRTIVYEYHRQQRTLYVLISKRCARNAAKPRLAQDAYPFINIFVTHLLATLAHPQLITSLNLADSVGMVATAAHF